MDLDINGYVVISLWEDGKCDHPFVGYYRDIEAAEDVRQHHDGFYKFHGEGYISCEIHTKGAFKVVQESSGDGPIIASYNDAIRVANSQDGYLVFLTEDEVLAIINK